MANWISSKLKVAENLLHQIDQQAAESLGKGERKQSEELNFETHLKPSGTVSLKDQLKKKAPENIDLIGKTNADRSNYNTRKTSSNGVSNSHNRKKEVSASYSVPKSSLTDSDWTELLSTPKHSSPVKSKWPNGKLGIRGVRKDGGKVGNLGLSVKGSGGSVGLLRRVDGGTGVKGNGELGDRRSNGEESRNSDSTPRSSNYGSDGKSTEGWEFGPDPAMLVKGDGEREVDCNQKSTQDIISIGIESLSENKSVEVDSGSTNEIPVAHNEPRKIKEAHNDDKRMRRNLGRVDKPSLATAHYASSDLKRGSCSRSDDESSSDSEGGSTSDSEIEREREERKKRTQQILAAKAAAKAAEAIKERENVVAKLEGEKQSLEKILEERAKQAAQEASELQSTMMAMMEAAELEKQKHNSTRMEALARLTKLETLNADLARSLANAQWNLEVEINRVGELRQEIELREAAHEELRRRIASTQQTGTSIDNSVASKGVNLEHEMLVAEYAFVTDKFERLQEKAKKLKEDIELTQKETDNPTEVEVELKRRLAQMTDHLIQKQSQVEALSSEKAMLLFRIEAVSKLLDENAPGATTLDLSGSSQQDLETGSWELSRSKLRPMFEDKIRSGTQRLGSLLRQLDAIFSAGAVLLRRNSTAKLLSLVYLLCLHFWVLYILFAHSPSSNQAKSGAVISLENINNTFGL